MRSAVWFVLSLLGMVAGAHGKNRDSGVKFNLYTRYNKSGQQMQWNTSSIHRSGYDCSAKTIFIVPGWTNNITSPMPTGLRIAFLNAGDYNVIVVDWTEYSSIKFYPISRTFVTRVGEAIARFLEFLYEHGLLTRKDTHIIGHSLGAHVAGNAGKALAKTGPKIWRITGLDPAGPLFFKWLTDGLAKNDAIIVDAVHTSANTLGVNYPLATVDFWVNGGEKQPGCGPDPSCSHEKCWRYYAESIVNQDAFKNATLREPDQNSTSHRVLAQMGHWLQYSVPGSYNVQTRAEPPYSLG